MPAYDAGTRYVEWREPNPKTKAFRCVQTRHPSCDDPDAQRLIPRIIVRENEVIVGRSWGDPHAHMCFM